MNLFKLTYFFGNLILSLTLLSCGPSPLFNHRKEKNQNERVQNKLIGACALKFNSANKCVELEFETTPTVGVMQTAEVRFDSALGENQSLEAFIWMPSMGHGSEDIQVSCSPDRMSCRLDSIYFLMAGDWDLHLTLRNEDGTSEELKVHYEL